jgi:hypothetical protein
MFLICRISYHQLRGAWFIYGYLALDALQSMVAWWR